MIADRIDQFEQGTGLGVMRCALSDGMVSGNADSGREHKEIAYIFGNAATFDRLRSAWLKVRKQTALSLQTDNAFETLYKAEAS